jgi:hypothetical protein
MAGKSRTGGLDFRSPHIRSSRPQTGFFVMLWQSLQVLILIAGLGMLMTAVFVQLSGSLRLAGVGLILAAAVGIATFWGLGQGRSAWGLALLVAVIASVWWATIRPSNSRIWAADVEHGVTATLTDGDRVTLSNIRNFRWTSREMFTPAWETRTYDLAQLTSMDVLTSAWSSPLIAHMMVSFGFADGRHLVFSTEIRREKGEAFSALGGFFKQFELVLIAADERDIIRLRTDIRGEAVSLFPLTVPKAVMQDAFRSFAGFGNDLAESPRFYNTVTTNCTTIPWRLARELAPGLPTDWRVYLSGHFPAYMRDLGLTGQGQSLQDMLAWARLRGPGPTATDGPAYSAELRGNGPAD